MRRVVYGEVCVHTRKWRVGPTTLHSERRQWGTDESKDSKRSVGLQEAVASFERVLGGIPELNARIDDLAAEDGKVYARLTVTGTNTGKFFGIPATGTATR